MSLLIQRRNCGEMRDITVFNDFFTCKVKNKFYSSFSLFFLYWLYLFSICLSLTLLYVYILRIKLYSLHPKNEQSVTAIKPERECLCAVGVFSPGHSRDFPNEQLASFDYLVGSVGDIFPYPTTNFAKKAMELISPE